MKKRAQEKKNSTYRTSISWASTNHFITGSWMRNLSIVSCCFRGILYLFRELKTASIKRVNDKVVTVTGLLIDLDVVVSGNIGWRICDFSQPPESMNNIPKIFIALFNWDFSLSMLVPTPIPSTFSIPMRKFSFFSIRSIYRSRD